MSLAQIGTFAAAHANAINELNALVTALNAQIEEIHQEADKDITRLVKRCKASREKLHSAIEASPDLFEKPKTLVLSGIKVGFRAGKATLDMDEGKTLELISKKLPGLKDVLIKTTQKPVADALMNLDAKQQACIGVTVIPGVDTVVLAPVDTAVNKVVNAYLTDA